MVQNDGERDWQGWSQGFTEEAGFELSLRRTVVPKAGKRKKR